MHESVAYHPLVAANSAVQERSKEGDQADVVIVGGGIGGLATAYALACMGVTVRVLERAAEFAEIGAGLQLAPNATRILRRFDLLDDVRATAVAPRRLVGMNAVTGDLLTTLDLDDVEERYGAPYIVTHRSDLLDVLLARCVAEPSIILETGKQVTAIADHGDSVQIDCADGTGYSTGAVLGADGLTSTTRSLFSDDEPICSGYVAYRGAVPVQDVARHASLDDVVIWIGPGLHLVQYPLRGGELYNQVAVFRSDEFAAGKTDWGTPEELDRRFADTCKPVQDALPSLLRDRRWAMSDRLPLRRWSAGRVALLGDAAHPMLQYLAQGACQAIEDSEVLGDTLGQVAGKQPSTAMVTEAFAEYERLRLEQASTVQRTARVWGDIWHVDGIAMTLRDEAFQLRDPDDFRRIDWLYGERPA
jgi:2-polyprenyl-6-methoxyphenol hydroxylase-like FAD-dependent oxidoreductase